MADNICVVQSVQIYNKMKIFIIAKYSTQQRVEEVFIRPRAQVYLH